MKGDPKLGPNRTWPLAHAKKFW
ncbi:hypothetical protein CCACVL1_07131, partial [Corchorus capsularis]